MKYVFRLNYRFSGAADNNFAKRLPRNNEKSFRTRTEPRRSLSLANDCHFLLQPLHNGVYLHLAASVLPNHNGYLWRIYLGLRFIWMKSIQPVQGDRSTKNDSKLRRTVSTRPRVIIVGFGRYEVHYNTVNYIRMLCKEVAFWSFCHIRTSISRNI